MIHLKIVARLDRAIPTPGTILIDRTIDTFSVRPHKRRRVYTMHLSTVAEIVVHKIIKAEIAEKRAAKAKKKGRK